MINFKRISKYDINIRHTANGGCIVNVGCCEASFSNTEDMIEALTEYYKNPDEMEKKYNAFAGPMEDVPSARECMPEPDNRALRRAEPDCDCPRDDGPSVSSSS